MIEIVDTKDFTIPKFELNSQPEDEVIFSEEEWKEMSVDSGSIQEEKKIPVAQLNSIAQWARGLRREEAKVAIDNLPLDLIFEKIGRELEKNKKFIEAVTTAMDIVK